MEIEVKSFLTSDYIYIPYDKEENLKLRDKKIVYKNDLITTFDGKSYYSPVSGLAYGLGEINTVNGIKKVLVIENDFKDKTYKKLISVKDIYSLDKEKILGLTENLCKSNTLTLIINYDDNNIKDECLLKDNIREILETLNIIDLVNDNVNIKIRLNKKDILSYQTLFSYLGTYPNFEIEFSKKNENEKTISIYDVLDIYNILKNKNVRDYIYLNLIHNKSIMVIKTKKNSNLKDLLVHLNLMSTNILINNKIKIENSNFLLDEFVNTINIL